MKELIIEHKEIAWAVSVLLFTIIMILFSTKVLNLIERKWKNSQTYASVFSSLRRLSKIFYILIGIGLVSYLFVEKETHETINSNLGRILWFGLVIAATIILSAISQGYFSNKIRKLSKRDKGDITLYKYIKYLATALIYLFGILMVAIAIPALSNVATAAGASAGVIALVAGVASQEGISNIIGGLFIAFFKPFRIGDIIKVGDSTMGRVEDINLRHTVINDFKNVRVVIPNAVVNKENITNYYMIESKNCEWVEVGISYDTDIDEAIAVMREVCEANQYCMDMRNDQEKESNKPIVDIQVIELGDYAIKLKAWVWSASYLTGFRMRNQIYKSLKEAFDREGIKIPFPHTQVVFDPAHVTKFAIN